MPSLLRRSSVVAVVALVAACGARSQLELGGAGRGGGIASGGGGSGPSGPGASSSTGSGGGGAPPACVGWSFLSSMPTKVPGGAGDTLLTSVVADGADVLVASTNDNDPSPQPTWNVVSINDHAEQSGLVQTVLSRPPSGVSFGGMSLAIGTQGRGGVAWDEVDGCRFVPLGEMGVPNGSPVTIPNAAWCYWLNPRKSGGFSMFSSAPFGLGSLALFQLDPFGEPLSAASSVPLGDDAAPAGRVQLADESLLLAWSLPDGVHVVHLDPNGGPIAPPVHLVASPIDATRFTLRALGDGAFMAWSPEPDPGDIHVQLLTSDLGLGASSVIASAVPLVDGIDAVEVPGGALVAWLTSESTSSLLTVQAIDASGAPVGPPLTDGLPSFANGVRIVRTPLGAMVVFEAEDAVEPVQIFALALQCET